MIVKFCGTFTQGSNDAGLTFISKIESAGLCAAGSWNEETGKFEFWAFSARSRVSEVRIDLLASDLCGLDGVVEMTMQPQRN